MPVYQYRCGNGHVTEIIHGMGEVVNVNCAYCGGALRRRYIMPNVKRSSFIEPSPAIRNWLDDTPARLERVAAKQEARKASGL